MDKLLEVYGITAHTQWVCHVPDTYNFSKHEIKPVGLMSKDATQHAAKIIRAQVKCYVLNGKRRYVALNPDLTCIIELEVTDKLADMRVKLHRAEGELSMMQRDYARFKALPWYVRLYRVLRNNYE